MASESSRSSSTADSYIGSLISLTSKSEIRYEGVLSNINTEESSIGLHNVRSFGTEGRKKDGPQVMPSDKVYEYILFRGSDIKDLQVKSSPPVQPAPPINSDPAIIQSHYPIPPRAISTPSTLPLSGSGSLSEIGPHPSQLGHPGSTFQSGLPLYQPGGSIGSWGPSPQNPNNSGLAMPMYWPGYYGPTNGLPLQQQQSLLRPPGGISMPPSMQPQSYPGFNPSPMPTTTSSSSSSLPASNFPSNLPPVPPMMMLASEPLPSFNKPVVPTSATLNANLSNLDLNAVVPSSSRPSLISAPPLSFSHPVSTMTGSLVVQTETEAPRPPPSLVTPGQLIPQSGGQVALSQPATQTQTAHKDVEVVQVSPTPTPAPEPQAPVVTEAQPPILPLPSPSRTVQKPNGAHYQARHNYRGRERGRGSGQNSRPTMKFTEEFDFTAMNEKFNKDEVWGHLGRSNNKSGSKEKVGDGNGSDEYESEDEDEEDVQVPKIEVKPVYSKDDFFDTLSCNSLDNQSNNGGRTRFSEQRKIDTETFGEFSRYRGGWGGRGRGGRSRGGGGGYGYGGGGGRGYGYGYGYGYSGRGRGGGGGGRNNIASRDF